jgi:hypothetical protein
MHSQKEIFPDQSQRHPMKAQNESPQPPAPRLSLACHMLDYHQMGLRFPKMLCDKMGVLDGFVDWAPRLSKRKQG